MVTYGVKRIKTILANKRNSKLWKKVWGTSLLAQVVLIFLIKLISSGLLTIKNTFSKINCLALVSIYILSKRKKEKGVSETDCQVALVLSTCFH